MLETIRTVWNRRPIDRVPVDFDRLGYKNASFDRDVNSPDFAGWPGDRPDREEVEVILKLLEPVAGDRLLDVACGYGRHSLPLAARGISVTGVDSSRSLVERAAKTASERGIRAEFRVLDARKLDWEGEFDRAVIAFNSFALFSPADAPGVLKGIRRALKPGGRLFMDLPNRRAGADYPKKHWRLGLDRGAIKLQEISFRQDPFVEVSRDLYIFLGRGEVQEFMICLRLYTHPEIETLLREGGFEIEAIFGDWDLSPMLAESRKIILAARRT